jgi:hypothetical protein
MDALPLWKVCFSYGSKTRTFMYIHATEVDFEKNIPIKIGKVVAGKFHPKRSLVDCIIKIYCSHDRYGYIRGSDDIGGSDGPVIVNRLWVERC